MSTVGVLGLGRLGLAFAYTLAAAGHEVYGWDSDPARRELSVMPEEGLPELMARHRVTVTDPEVIAAACDAAFIVVPTPSKPDGMYDHRLVELAAVSLPPGGPLRTVVVVSTVSPGTCRMLEPTMTALGRDLVYAPMLVSLHTVVRDLRMASVWILGCSERAPAERVAAMLHQVSRRATPVICAHDTAELAKIAVNMRMMLDITYANQLQRMAWMRSEHGADVDQITTALHLAARRAPMLAGAGFGGPCLPRDGAAFLAAGGAYGEWVDEENRIHLGWIVDQLCGAGPVGPRTFAVLGTAYKEKGSYADESFGLKIRDELALWAAEVPAGEAEVVVIALPLAGQTLGPFRPGARVIDLWRTHPYLAAEDVVYVPVGGQL
jgi:UDPglucose 6-dehydrogenase